MNNESKFRIVTQQHLTATNGLVSRDIRPAASTLIPSLEESLWREYESPDNTIIVTQAGEAYFKGAVGVSIGGLGTIARRLHDFIEEGRELRTDDPFEYVEAKTRSREELGSGGEGTTYRIKGTNLAIKMRLNQGQIITTGKEYLEKAEAVRMALDLERAESGSVDVRAVPIYMMIGPNDLSLPSIETPLELIVMPYIQGPTMYNYARSSRGSERNAREDEYDAQIKVVRDIVQRRVSREVIPDLDQLDLSMENVLRSEVDGRVTHWILDYVV